jgi:hypothetical protein
MAPAKQPDVQVEDMLKTLGIESLCQWDVLVFQYRHQSSLVSTEHIVRFLGYASADVVAALNHLESSGLVERSRDTQGVRLYQVTRQVTGWEDPARRDALERLLTFVDSHTGRLVRLLLAERLRGSDRLDPNKSDFPLHDVKGEGEHD